MISERTRDKIAATRRKGKWSGGAPVLGYNVIDQKLVIDESEAERVREIFDQYLKYESTVAVAKELNRRGWRTKSWTTKKEQTRGGYPFSKTRLHHLLTNVVYVGKVRYKSEVHTGEHKAIIATEVFARVQVMLKRNGRSGGRTVRNKYEALLRGLVQCGSCGCGMSHSYTTKGTRVYRYYVCDRAQQRGWDACPAPSVSATALEQFVIDEIKCVAKDPQVIRETIAQVDSLATERTARLRDERTQLNAQLKADHQEMARLAGSMDTEQLAVVLERVRIAEQRLGDIERELQAERTVSPTDAEVARTLAEFEKEWECLAPSERTRLIDLLVERVVYDGPTGNVSLTFKPTGIRGLSQQTAQRKDGVAA